MLDRWLHHIRQQPKPVRERYALIATLAVMAIIIGGWGYTLPSRFANESGADQGASAPLSGIWNNIKSQYESAPPPLPPSAILIPTPEEVRAELEREGSVSPPAPERPAVLIATTSTRAGDTFVE